MVHFPDQEVFFDGFEVVRARESDIEMLVEFLCADFMMHEPHTVSVEASREDMEGLLKDLVVDAISKAPFTYIVRATVEPHEIAAIRLASIVTRDEGPDEPLPEPDVAQTEPEYSSWKAVAILRLLTYMEKQTWNLLPKSITKLATWCIITVSRDYTRRGLAQKLLEFRLDELKAHGCQGIVAEATAHNSQKLFGKLGYTTLLEVLDKDWKDEDGKQIFKCLDNTDRSTLVYKPLP
uniref:aralkylamine N-acetyltransferase n=1 Tax=Panagrellus redivivus TaxID=6233 RepID=A0A7E4ZYQ1_PANRE